MTKNEQDKAEIAKAIEILHLMRRVVDSGKVVELKQGRSSSVGAESLKHATLSVEMTIAILPEEDYLGS